MMVSNIGICEFCGQTHIMETSSEMTIEQAKHAAIAICDCPGASKRRSLDLFEEQIRQIAGQEAMDNGFRGPAPDGAIEMIRNAAISVYDAAAQSVTIQLSKADRVKVHEGKNGILQLTRREVREA